MNNKARNPLPLSGGVVNKVFSLTIESEEYGYHYKTKEELP